MELREIESLGFECTPPTKPPPNPLQSLFSQDQITLLELMSIQNLSTLVKETASTFSMKLLNHRQLVKDIIDCALRPDKLLIPQLDTTWPFLAAEFLAHQEEEFYKSFFSSTKSAESQQTHSDSGSRVQGSELLEWLFKILEQPKPINNTSAGYLLRIFNQIYYANQQQFFWYFVNNQQTLASCIEHLYNPSILEIIWRIVDTYNEDIDNKVSIINKVLEGGMVASPFTLETLESVQLLVENLIERSEEINTKKLSIRLCREVICKQNIDLIRKLLCSYDQSSTEENILNQCTILLNTYLRFFIQQKNPKKEAYKMQSSIEFVTITDQLLDQIVTLMRHLFHLWFKKYPKQQRKLSKYMPIAVLHSVLKLKPIVAQELIFEPFIGLCINLMKEEKKNNIMHNEIKGVLELAFSTKAAQWIITPDLLLFITDSFSASAPNEPPYLNQLFHISEIIQEHINPSKISEQVLEKWNSFISGKYKARKELYSTPLAKETSQKKDFFSEQEEVLSEEGDENGDIVIIKKYSQEDLAFPMFQKLRLASPPPEFEQIQISIPANLADSGQLGGDRKQKKEPAEQRRDAQEEVKDAE